MPSPRQNWPKLPVGMELEDFAESSVARIYVEFAVRNMLMNQSDESLSQRELLIENGGLCGFACISNITGAIAARKSNFLSFPENAPKVTERLVKFYSLDTGTDGRLGTYVSTLIDTMGSRITEVLQEFEYSNLLESLHVSASHLSSDFSPEQIASEFDGDTISLAAVKAVGALPEEKGHAIVVLGIDVERRKLVISDPNHPNQILLVPYYSSFGSNIQFRVPFTFGDRIVEFYEMSFLERHIYKSK